LELEKQLDPYQEMVRRLPAFELGYLGGLDAKK
jgi:hypothetical protein